MTKEKKMEWLNLIEEAKTHGATDSVENLAILGDDFAEWESPSEDRVNANYDRDLMPDSLVGKYDEYELWEEIKGAYKEGWAESMKTQRELLEVMTPAEIEKEFDLQPGTVRQAVGRGVVPHRRPDERTILIRRRDAVVRWEKAK
ncbi:MAG: hypothetical protein ACYTEQ_06615 [Planctomycetota bacterium]